MIKRCTALYKRRLFISNDVLRSPNRRLLVSVNHFRILPPAPQPAALPSRLTPQTAAFHSIGQGRLSSAPAMPAFCGLSGSRCSFHEGDYAGGGCQNWQVCPPTDFLGGS